MRPLILFLALLVSSPGLAATAALCAFAAAGATAMADNHHGATTPAQLGKPPPPAAIAASHPLPEALASVPFVRHVIAAGASVIDLGQTHGMLAVAARNGTRFMVFEVTPDGQVGIAGAIVELTPAQLETIASGNITDLGVEHGLAGFFVRSGPQFQVFYATPDNERLIPGVMWDANGTDLTRRQVAAIPGAVPTVVVGAGGPQRQGSSESAFTALPLLQKAYFGTTGRTSAPELFELIDPQCIYSVRALQMLEPYVASGRIRVAVVPVAVLDPEDRGQSTQSALALLSKPPGQLVAAWQAGAMSGGPSPEAAERLRANMAIARAIGLKGTPTFIWGKTGGTEGRIDGIPIDIGALVSSVGG
jgi:thiol:disulfide interchange protein DsbG